MPAYLDTSRATGAPTLVALHGFTGSTAVWQPLLAQLEGFGTHTLVRLPGHHAEAPVVDGGFDANVDALAAALGDAGPRPRVLLGYSLGARLALRLALRQPAVCDRLVLIGVNAGLDDPSERRQRHAGDSALCELIAGRGLEAFVDEWQRLPLFASQQHNVSPEGLAAQRAARLRHDPAALVAALEALGLAAMPSCWPQLGSLRLPLTLVVGEQDLKFKGIAERMRHELPAAELVVVPRVGHNVLLEAPAALAAVLEPLAAAGLGAR